MAKANCNRPGCLDVFNAFLLENAEYIGELEIPVIKNINNESPKKLIKFSEIFRTSDFNAYVHFYEDDCKFEKIWKNPKRYLERLKKFKGVISPDFSIYRDMPLIMQYWNIFRSRAIATWLKDNGINVIPNVRTGDERTFEIACEGIEKDSIIAIGSHGCIKCIADRVFFQKGLDYIINSLSPKIIILYGAKPDSIFNKYEEKVTIINFKDEFYNRRKN
jgi:hypothetical protein